MAGVRKRHGGGGEHGSNSSSSSSSAIPDQDKDTCPICFETLAIMAKGGRAVRSSFGPSSSLGGKVLCDCGHTFCRTCLSTYVSMAIRERRTSKGMLRCPVEKCETVIQASLLRDLVSPEDWNKHCRFVEELKLVQHRLLRFCPRPQCDGQARLTRQISDNGVYVEVACRTCQHDFCANCGSGPHQGKGCEEAGDKDYIKWKNGRIVKSCPGCSHDTEKNSGCAVMGCTGCGTIWCWDCGCKCRECKCGAVTRHTYFLLTPILYVEYQIRRLGWVPGWLEDLLFSFLIDSMLLTTWPVIFVFWDFLCYGPAEAWRRLVIRWMTSLEPFTFWTYICISSLLCFVFVPRLVHRHREE